MEKALYLCRTVRCSHNSVTIANLNRTWMFVDFVKLGRPSDTRWGSGHLHSHPARSKMCQTGLCVGFVLLPVCSLSFNHDTVFLVSGRSNELKKLPCKFQRRVKLKANAFFFSSSSSSFFSSHWCTRRRSPAQMVRVHLVPVALRHCLRLRNETLQVEFVSGERGCRRPEVWFGVSTNTEARGLDAAGASCFLELTMSYSVHPGYQSFLLEKRRKSEPDLEGPSESAVGAIHSE